MSDKSNLELLLFEFGYGWTWILVYSLVNKRLSKYYIFAIPHIFPNIQYRILKIVKHALALRELNCLLYPLEYKLHLEI